MVALDPLKVVVHWAVKRQPPLGRVQNSHARSY